MRPERQHDKRMRDGNMPNSCRLKFHVKQGADRNFQRSAHCRRRLRVKSCSVHGLVLISYRSGLARIAKRTRRLCPALCSPRCSALVFDTARLAANLSRANYCRLRNASGSRTACSVLGLKHRLSVRFSASPMLSFFTFDTIAKGDCICNTSRSELHNTCSPPSFPARAVGNISNCASSRRWILEPRVFATRRWWTLPLCEYVPHVRGGFGSFAKMCTL